jgi:3-phosphoshikimate 1-carboxyvinyltransferase
MPASTRSVPPGASGKLRANPSRRLRGSVQVPGDKSISHRALILAGLAHGQSVIHGLLTSDDVLRTASAIGALGASLERRDGSSWTLNGGSWHCPDRLIDCGNSGTAARLLIGAVAGRQVSATFTGDDSLRTRPMARVVEPLVAMGADIERRSYLPIAVRGRPLHGIRYRTPVPSAQVKSAILLAGLRAEGNVEVIEPLPSRDHTERMLEHLGCEIEIEDRRDGHAVRLGRSRALNGRHIVVPGDPSSAAFAILAALITPDSEVALRSVLDSKGRNGLIETLIEMGADIEISNRKSLGGTEVMDVTARSSDLRGVRVPAARAPSMIDEYPALAAAAAIAAGETVIEGLAELRVKESDRLGATQAGLGRCDVEAFARGDALHVIGTGKPPRGGAEIETHGDHRIAMAFLVLGLGARRPVSVDRPEMIATSFPDFAGFMRGLGAEIETC